MNIRSFKRELQRRKSGWQKGMESYTFSTTGNLESQLRTAFDECLKNVMEEIARQNERGTPCPIMAWGVIENAGGQTFTITIEGHPPTMPSDPNLN